MLRHIMYYLAACGTLIAMLSLAGCSNTTSTAAAPTLALTATPALIDLGSSTTLSWHATNALTVAKSNFTAKDLDGSLQVTPTDTTTYSLTVSGAGGDVTATVTVTVAKPDAPTVTLTSDTQSVNLGDSTTLHWLSVRAVSVTSNFGTTAPSGSLQVTPTQETTYTINVTGLNGTASASAKITIVDTHPPVIANPIVTPASLPTQGGTATISADVTDVTAVQSVFAIITKTGSTATTRISMTKGAGTTYSGTWTVAPNVRLDGQPDQYQVSIHAIDTLGYERIGTAIPASVAAIPSLPPLPTGI